MNYWDSELRRGASFDGVVAGFVGSPEFDEAYRRMDESAQAISSSLDLHGFDEVLFKALDSWPEPQFVLAIHASAVKSSCLTFLGRAPYPEQVAFIRAPYLRSELNEAFLGIKARLDGEHPAALRGSRGRLRLDIDLAGPALPVVDGILADYGDYIESVTVGAFPFPMPDPLPDPVCLSAPDAVDPWP